MGGSPFATVDDMTEMVGVSSGLSKCLKWEMVLGLCRLTGVTNTLANVKKETMTTTQNDWPESW